MARGPRRFRYLIFTLSDPVELLFLVSFMACVVWWLEMRMGLQCSFFVCLSTFLFVLLVACFTVGALLVWSRRSLVAGSVHCVPVTVSVPFVVAVLFTRVFR